MSNTLAPYHMVTTYFTETLSDLQVHSRAKNGDAIELAHGRDDLVIMVEKCFFGLWLINMLIVGT